ncbi:MAG: replication restart helicase PriA [Formosimonas sp.]
MKPFILQIACDIPSTASVTGVFDYLAPEHSSHNEWLGHAVLVPFGGQTLVGWVVGSAEHSEVPAEKLKTVLARIPFIPPVDVTWLALIRFVARYYQRGLGEVALPALPLPLRQARHFAIDEATGECTLRKGQASWKKWTQLPPVAAPIDLGASLPLTATQTEVLNALTAAGSQPQLLFGVTGSGKTEVYLQFLSQILQADSTAQVLILVPEINLTPQLAQRLNQRFGAGAVATLHSKLSDSERLLNFWRVAHGQARVILGTRLAILSPLPHLKAIVVDEEHDTSYRQMEGVRYSARDVAIYRAHQLNIPIVLGSATPSLESWHNAQTGRYGLLRLSQRAVASAALPQVQLVDVQKNAVVDGLSNPARNAIERTIAARQTSLLFQNRRGYAPVVYCGHCAHTQDCPACSAHLVYHQTTRRLHCHHCGREQAVPKSCSHCGNADMLPIGQGTQRLEESVQKSWPAAVVRRVDADSTRKKGELAHALADIAAGVVDVIVGTQMLAKGHDWPNLTTVVALDVDSGLFSQDYRAPERLFAQLQQVIGRAGRGEHAGRVLIQTGFIEHPLWGFLLQHDFEGFANDELAVREQLGLPPFAAHALLHVSAANIKDALHFANAARAAAQELIHANPQWASITLNAAVPMNLVRVNQLERAQLLIECPSRARLQQFLPHWQAELVAQKSRLAWLIEVDPAEI